MRGIRQHRWINSDYMETHPFAAATVVSLLFLFGFVLTLLLGGCAFYPQLAAAPRPLPVQLDYAVRVEVFCLATDPWVAMIEQTEQMSLHAGEGSGVILDARHVLTAHHVTACAYLPDIHIITARGKRMRAVIDKEWLDHDLTRLVLASSDTFDDNLPPPRFGMPPLKGMMVCSASAVPKREGACGEYDASHTLACLQDMAGDSGCHDMTMSLIVNRGNSGGGLYNEFGELVGIVTAGRFDFLNNPIGTGFAVSLWELRTEVMPQ